MPLFSQLVREVAGGQPRPGNRVSTRIVTPWSDSPALEQVLIAEALGIDSTLAPVTRAAALGIPAVAKARAVIVSELAPRALQLVEAGTVQDAAPAWLSRCAPGVTPFERMADTLDDLMFYGWSLWLIDRDEGTSEVLVADRIPWDDWHVNEDARVVVGEVIQPDERIALIRGPFDGLLAVGQSMLRAALDTERAYAARARNPIPAFELHETEDNGMTADEAKAYVAAVAKARRDPDGAVMFTPNRIQLNALGGDAPNMLIEARNAIRLDVANMLNLPTAALDGTVSEASLTYVTVEGQQQVLRDRMVFWSRPIEDRLSLDDLVPSPAYVRFDFSDRSTDPADTGSTAKD